MAGRKGRSGGHNRLSPAEHVLRGTWNATRHRVPVVTPAAVARVEPVPAALLNGLVGPGKGFVEECWRTYSGWTPPTRALLREAGLVLDALEGLRGQKGERAAQRMLLSTLAALRLDVG